MRLAKVRHREVVEVLLGDEDIHALVVDGQEGGKAVEVVRGAHLLDRGIWQSETVASSELKLQFGLERPLDVQVQLSLGHSRDKRRQLAQRSTSPLDDCKSLVGRLP